MKTVDLRSDTVTRPTAAMRAAMADADLGDDVFGDDPTVNALQQRIAALLGKEAALFVPSGTQSNLVAIMSHCGRGDEYIVGQFAHTYRWEGGGAAVLGSVQPQPLEHQPDGSLALAAIEAAIKPDDSHFARSRLLCLENTIGGKVLPVEYLAEAAALARGRGLATHLDGARLFNAAVALAARSGDGGGTALVGSEATGGSASSAAGASNASQPSNASPASGDDALHAAAIAQGRAMASHFDTVSVCFSKGLGAPVGSALVGPRALIEGAHRWRKMLGGGMRQAGVLAAAGLHALDHHVPRLAQDHARARRLAAGLEGVPGLTLQAPQSNMVFAEVRGERAAGLVEHLKSRGVLAIGLYQLRFVTHLDVDDEGVDRAVAAVREHLDR